MSRYDFLRRTGRVMRRCGVALLGLGALGIPTACAHSPTGGGNNGGGGGGPPVPGDVAVWLTTSDGRKLLARQADLRFGTSTAGVQGTIDVDTATRYQEMVGFGAAFTGSSAWLIQYRMSGAQRDALMRELFGRDSATGGLGLSWMRLPMGASDFSLHDYSYDDMPAGQSDTTLSRFSVDSDRVYILPTVKQALAINPQLKIVASPWSPPGWMKTTGSLIQGTLKPEYYPAFARYFQKFIQAYAAEGVPIYAVTLQNEPHYEPGDYPGMRLDETQRATLIGQHVGPLFAREGIGTIILDWDHNWDEPNSPLTVLADATARQYVSGVAWHCYGGNVSAQAQVHDAHPDKDAYFTECSGGNWAPNFADNLKWFTQKLVIGSVRGWSRGVALWNLALSEKHGPHTGGCSDCRGVVTIDSSSGSVTRNEEYYALGHASRFVRPGARRIGSNSGVVGLEDVAFHNADDGSKVLVVVNTATEARTFFVRQGGHGFVYTLPAGAVATFRWP